MGTAALAGTGRDPGIAALVRRGALAGVAAALLMMLVLVVLTEPVIDDAIALEETNAAAAGHGEGPAEAPLVSRSVQKLGGGLGVILYGLGLGIAFGVAYGACRHLVGGVSEAARVARFAFVGFTVAILIPFLKYPSNPPAVGDPDTITRRTLLWVAMVLGSVLAAWAGTWVRRRLAGRFAHQPEVAVGAGLLAWVVLVVALWVVLPGSPDTISVPVDLIWRFRLRSLAGTATFWAALGAAFAWLSLRPGAPATQ